MAKTKAKAQPLEYYETPTQWNEAALSPNHCPVTLLCRLIGKEEKANAYHNTKVLDLGAGTGAIGLAVKRNWTHPRVKVYGVEYSSRRAEQAMSTGAYEEVLTGDIADTPVFQQLADRGLFDLVVANPPFSNWENFTRTAISLRRADGLAAILLPSNATEAPIGSRKGKIRDRAALWRARDVGRADLARRLSFVREFETDEGVVRKVEGSAMSAYFWGLWGASWGGRYAWLDGSQ